MMAKRVLGYLISQLDIETLELNTGKERWRKFCEKQKQEKEEITRRQKAGRERWLMLLLATLNAGS